MAVDLEGDTAHDEPTMGATEVVTPVPMLLFGRRMWSLFLVLRVPVLQSYVSHAFCQQTAWACAASAAADECEPVYEDEGAHCDDEGMPNDNGIADWDGMGEGYTGGPLGRGLIYG